MNHRDTIVIIMLSECRLKTNVSVSVVSPVPSHVVMQEMSFTAIFYAGPQVSEQQH